MGIFPKWVSELSWADFWGGVKEDVAKIPKTVGSTVGSTIEGIVKPILSGARKALSPTVIWIVVIAVIALILFTYFKKAVKI